MKGTHVIELHVEVTWLRLSTVEDIQSIQTDR